jgi:phage-related protein
VIFAAGLQADIVSQIESAIISFFTSIWNGIVSFFGQIFTAVANVITTIFQAPVNAITSSWVSFQVWANGFGPIAPLLTILMVGLFFAVAVFFIWLLAKLSVSEGEQTAEEAEEGV